MNPLHNSRPPSRGGWGGRYPGAVCGPAVSPLCAAAELGRTSGDFYPSPRGWDYGAADAALIRPAGARPAAVRLQQPAAVILGAVASRTLSPSMGLAACANLRGSTGTLLLSPRWGLNSPLELLRNEFLVSPAHSSLSSLRQRAPSPSSPIWCLITS